MGAAVAGVVLASFAAGLATWWWVPRPGLARLSPPEPRWGEGVRADIARWWREATRGRALRARETALRASVAAVCDLLAVCLDAGRPPRSALRVVCGVVDGPVREELDGVLARIDLGVDEAEAWAGLGAVPGFREVARDLSRSVRSGLGLAGLLRQHAVDARADTAARALTRARAAGVRSVVPLMVCFLPAFILLGVAPLFGALVGRLFS